MNEYLVVFEHSTGKFLSQKYECSYLEEVMDHVRSFLRNNLDYIEAIIYDSEFKYISAYYPWN